MLIFKNTYIFFCIIYIAREKGELGLKTPIKKIKALCLMKNNLIGNRKKKTSIQDLGRETMTQYIKERALDIFKHTLPFFMVAILLVMTVYLVLERKVKTGSNPLA